MNPGLRSLLAQPVTLEVTVTIKWPDDVTVLQVAFETACNNDGAQKPEP